MAYLPNWTRAQDETTRAQNEEEQAIIVNRKRCSPFFVLHLSTINYIRSILLTQNSAQNNILFTRADDAFEDAAAAAPPIKTPNTWQQPQQQDQWDEDLIIGRFLEVAKTMF